MFPAARRVLRRGNAKRFVNRMRKLGKIVPQILGGNPFATKTPRRRQAFLYLPLSEKRNVLARTLLQQALWKYTTTLQRSYKEGRRWENQYKMSVEYLGIYRFM